MKVTELEAWCAWHERWEERFTCSNCGEAFPVCYIPAHLRFACSAMVPA